MTMIFTFPFSTAGFDRSTVALRGHANPVLIRFSLRGVRRGISYRGKELMFAT